MSLEKFHTRKEERQHNLDLGLLHAASIENIEDLQDHLKRGANPNFQDKGGRSALHKAIMAASSSGSEMLVMKLIESGADVSLCDNDNCNALDFAIHAQNNTIVKSLILSGAEVDISKDNDWTPLHHAAIEGDVEVLQTLLNNGADVRRLNVSKETPLHLAATGQSCAAVSFLLEHGVEVNALTTSNENALHYAARHGNSLEIALLLKAGVDASVEDNAQRTPLATTVQFPGSFNTDTYRALIQHCTPAQIIFAYEIALQFSNQDAMRYIRAYQDEILLKAVTTSVMDQSSGTIELTASKPRHRL